MNEPPIFDTGSTSNFGTIQGPYKNITPLSPPYPITCPNGSIMHATHEAELDLPSLPKQARHTYIVPDLKSATLLSVGHLCDHNCSALFEKHQVTIFHDGQAVLHGTRKGPTHLWQLEPSKSQPQPIAAQALATRPSFLPARTSTADIVAFLHAALGSPSNTTLLSALDKGYIHSFPGLTSKSFRNHTPFSVASIKGHQDALRQNIQSTRPKPLEPDTDEVDDYFPSPSSPNTKTHEIHTRCLEITGKAYSDLTGEFVLPSSRGNKYVLVLYDYDSNHVFATPLKSRTASAILEAHQTILSQLKAAGFYPKLLILDNECPTSLKNYLKSENIDFQLVPPHRHRRNAAERAIRTWKNHFLAILCSTDDGFPLHLWDHLILQANITLNLLRGSRINPKLSAWAQIHGAFDYNRTPLAPPGTRVLAHEPAAIRGSWAPHATEGWYIGPALDSYRCFTVWIDSTRRTRIVERCTWFPTKVHLPLLTTADTIAHALQDLSEALQAPSTEAILPHLEDSDRQALIEINTILSNADGTASASPLLDEPDATSPRVAPRRSSRLAQANMVSLAASPSTATNLCYKVVHPDTGKLVEYQDLRTSSEGARWELACAREWARLMQGLPAVDIPHGRNTITFIHKNQVPSGRRITYLRIVSNYRPQKSDPYRIRFTVGGDRLSYDGDTATRTSDLTTFKLCINAVLSHPSRKACTIDLSDFYLCHRLEEPEFMRIHHSLVPQVVQDHYDVTTYTNADGYVYVRIDGGMYGLKQAGRISNDALVKHLSNFDFIECPFTPGLFRHRSRDIFFCLVVDDFFVGYADDQDAHYLLTALTTKYQATIDWAAELFSGITLCWDFEKRTCDLSMPGYIAKALHRFEHPIPLRPQDSPHPWTPPVYGATIQYPAPDDTTPKVSLSQQTRIQEILGTLLYYARAVDDTMLVTINSLAAEQAQATEATLDRIVWLLNYAATHPDTVLRYQASDMYLWVHSDASYLSEPNAGSRYAGFFFLSSRPDDPNTPPKPGDPPPPFNGPILVTTHRLKEVVASAAESELGGLFHNARDAEPIRTTLEELGYPQGPTPLQTDNTTAAGIANRSVKLKRSKAMTMRYFWVQDRVSQNHFRIYWDRGLLNLADYFTKHHPPSHHRLVRPVYHPSLPP